MRLLSSFFLIFSLGAAEFQSYDAKFVFETKFGDFPLKRYFVVKEQEINTRVTVSYTHLTLPTILSV